METCKQPIKYSVNAYKRICVLIRSKSILLIEKKAFGPAPEILGHIEYAHQPQFKQPCWLIQ